MSKNLFSLVSYYFGVIRILHVEIIHLYQRGSDFRDSSRRNLFWLPQFLLIPSIFRSRISVSTLLCSVLSPPAALSTAFCPPLLSHTKPPGTAFGRSPAQFFCAGSVYIRKFQLESPNLRCPATPRHPGHPTNMPHNPMLSRGMIGNYFSHYQWLFMFV